jgi:hypothetical protein
VANDICTRLELTHFERTHLLKLIDALLSGTTGMLLPPAQAIINDIETFLINHPSEVPKLERQADGHLTLARRVDNFMSRDMSKLANTIDVRTRGNLFLVVNDPSNVINAESNVTSISPTVAALYVAKNALPFIGKKLFPSIRTDRPRPAGSDAGVVFPMRQRARHRDRDDHGLLRIVLPATMSQATVNVAEDSLARPQRESPAGVWTPTRDPLAQRLGDMDGRLAYMMPCRTSALPASAVLIDVASVLA